MIRWAVTFGWLACLFATVVCGSETDKCVDVHIDPDYRSAIVANDFVMLEGGVDALTLPGDIAVLVGVGQVAIKVGSTPNDILKARRVAESKATRAVGEYLRSDISAVQTMIKRTTEQSTRTDGESRERTRRVEKYLTTHIDVRSELVARIKRVGSWSSADGRYVYVAVAVAPLD